ncbi:hypothetical protein A4X09_0g5946 [Tilletia walkeri]|uniref:Uncharacterized protein n=1 Tax=Tilletia walkeri TaxID=117179 RepID=A0A8X7N5C7_9BASI|nr:hypothetical protein A4X09_0g5946 [Tilletia walkeri]
MITIDFDFDGNKFDFDGADQETSFSNLVVVPFFLFVVSLALPSLTRMSINVRRALKRYDQQTKPLEHSSTHPPQQDRVGLGKRALDAIPTLVHAIVSLLVCVYILEWTNSSDDSSPEYLDHYLRTFLAAMTGVFLSYLRPFSSIFLYKYRAYALRSKPSSKANKKSLGVPVLTEQYTPLHSTASWLKTTLELVRPVVVGLATAMTGLLLPFVFIIWNAYRMAAFLPQGASLRQVVGGVIGITALFLGLIAAAVALLVSIRAESSRPDKEIKDGNGRSGSNILTQCYALSIAVCSLLPLVLTVATARNFDLRNIEEAGDLDAELQRLRNEVDQLLSEHEEKLPVTGTEGDERLIPSPKIMIFSVPSLDKNGKVPQAVEGTKAIDKWVRMGNPAFAVHGFKIGDEERIDVYDAPADMQSEEAKQLQLAELTRTSRRAASASVKLISKLPVLDLPTWSSAVTALQLCAIAGIMVAFAGNGDSELPSAVHPIKLLDLFVPSVADRGDAVTNLALLAWAWSLMAWVVMVASMLVSVYWRGGMQSLKKLWIDEDKIWFEEAEQQKDFEDLEEAPLLIDVE